MTGLDIFALVVLIVIICSAVVIFVTLGMLPGKIAKDKQHPQVEAITVGSWVALIVGGVLWPLILIWAYYNYEDRTTTQNKTQTEEGGKS